MNSHFDGCICFAIPPGMFRKLMATAGAAQATVSAARRNSKLI